MARISESHTTVTAKYRYDVKNIFAINTEVHYKLIHNTSL